MTATSEIMIRNARLFDGTGAAAVVRDLSVADGIITAIGRDLPGTAAQEMDGSGLALAPGFIDVHTHDDAMVLQPGGMEPKLSQGVTSVVTGNCGICLAPGLPEGASVPTPPLDLLGDAAAFRFPEFGDFIDALHGSGPEVNVFPLVGQTLLRLRAMDRPGRPATAAEVERMREDLARAIAGGAAGLSTGLAYPPARFASTDEILALARDVAAAGLLWTTHMRDERSGVVSAVAETLDIARRSGVRTLISHHKCCSQAAFGLSRTTLAMIEEARKELSVGLDLYPYTASSTVLLPTFARDSTKVTVTWSDPHPEMEGRDLKDIAAEWGVSQDEALERLKPGGAIYHQMDEGDLRRIMAYPPTLIGSDGLPQDRRPHPRLWGTFPRVLGHFARDEAVLPLETAIAKMTGQTAALLGLKDRGLLKPGCKADLVLFDPEQVIDRASYAEPTLPPAGIRQVWVNGAPVVEDGAYRPGRPGAGTVIGGCRAAA
ncbi:N-acyl-D-amino-acid deacylase family protein [Frigidibacter sp. ROC022]|uniref:N-acyl-D-amino-acid deacylase family protein n=1 Tax=Frigidibacter sp. ROC022 TaxID=2971796 RepID=UPI00215B4BF1|nr:D-aminoacylase [Frigidibacter sp. ROC022]MCR8726056.1 D-aminoacylase [Frigidibacter sp. ROC022]